MPRLLLGSPAGIGQMTVAQQALLSRYSSGGPRTRRSTGVRAKRRKGMRAFTKKYGALPRTGGYDDASFLTGRRRKKRTRRGGRLRKGSAAAKRRMAALRRMRRR